MRTSPDRSTPSPWPPVALGALGGVSGMPVNGAASWVASPVGPLLFALGAAALTGLIFRSSSGPRTYAWDAWRATVWLLASAVVALPIVVASPPPQVGIVLPVLTGILGLAVDRFGRRLFGSRVAPA